MYTLTLDGHTLHRYKRGFYGWLPRDSITGQPGKVATWPTREEAEAWTKRNYIFCAGAVVLDASADRGL